MRFASENIPPCRGLVKSAPEDFLVDEIPAYDFSGSGDHTLVQVEKTGISTFEAQRRICREIRFSERNVGYAGLKDSRGITRQWFSFEHVEPARFEALQIPRLRITRVTRHGNKLKRGHLSGNRFEITLREVAAENVPHALAALAVLQKRGVPNWYDAQRFGRAGDNDVLGLALVRRDWPGFFEALLGGPDAPAHAPTRAARKAFADSRHAEALELWPLGDNLERGALKALLEYGPTDRAVKRLPQRMKQLYVSSLQSRLFNSCLEGRFAEFDRVWEGDLCEKENGSCFPVTDAAAEQPRADALEISPTGPVFGHKMQQPSGRESDLEQSVLAQAGLKSPDFEVGGGLSQKGDRRAYRFALRDVAAGYDSGARALKLAFTLPKGCYATVVLKEITKDTNGE